MRDISTKLRFGIAGDDDNDDEPFPPHYIICTWLLYRSMFANCQRIISMNKF